MQDKSTPRKGTSRRIDRTGQRYGRLVVLAHSHTRRAAYWLCICDCGNETVVQAANLASGGTRSCGCLSRELSAARAATGKAHLTHGLSRTATYRAWHNAKSRCTIPNHPYYADYGGRGIEHRFDSVADLVADIGERPAPDLTLDRIDNDGHYEPGNVRWATWKTQVNNRRVSKGDT